MRLKVTFCGRAHEFVMESTDTVSDLMLVFQREFEVSDEYTNFRLLHKGRDIFHEPGELSKLVGDGGKVMVMASLAKEVQAIASYTPKVIKTVDIAPINLSTAAQKRRRQQGPATSRYINAIKELPEFPRAREAKDILVQIASDPGIVGVLNKHQWNIGLLTELSPFNKPGADGKTLLGLNKNKGQEILLRLRHTYPPSDEDLFLPYSQIRDTMLHELTHCVHGPHNDAFYTLYRQLVKECREMDYRGKGRRVGGREIYMPDDDDDVDAPTYSIARTAGGDMDRYRQLRGSGYTPAQVAAASAILRLSEDEKRLEAGCGSGNGDATAAAAAPSPAARASTSEAPATPAAVVHPEMPQASAAAPAAEPTPAPVPASAAPVVAIGATAALGTPPTTATTAPAGASEPRADVCSSATTTPDAPMKPPAPAVAAAPSPPAPDAPPVLCPICQEVMPPGSSDRYVDNHVEQCLSRMAGGGSGGGPIPDAATGPGGNALGADVPMPADEPAVEPTPAGAADDDAAGPTCPICFEAFPPGTSERYISNHVDQCLLRA